MTREQAIEVLGMVEAHGGIVIEAKSMAIEALKFQGKAEVVISQLREDRDRLLTLVDAKRCEDTISRQAVLEINESHHGEMPNHINHRIWEEIKALPPVNPIRSRGHWIEGKYKDTDIRYNETSYKCSRCGEIVDFEKPTCPNCSADMREEQE